MAKTKRQPKVEPTERDAIAPVVESTPVSAPQAPYRIEEAKRLFPINTYLLSKNVKLHHIPALREFAKGVKIATRERWEEIFRDY